MSSTRISRRVNAPRANVYRALLDAHQVSRLRPRNVRIPFPGRPWPLPGRPGWRVLLGTLPLGLRVRQDRGRAWPFQPRGLEEDERGEPAGFFTGQPEDPIAIRGRAADMQLDCRARPI